MTTAASDTHVDSNGRSRADRWKHSPFVKRAIGVLAILGVAALARQLILRHEIRLKREEAFTVAVLGHAVEAYSLAYGSYPSTHTPSNDIADSVDLFATIGEALLPFLNVERRSMTSEHPWGGRYLWVHCNGEYSVVSLGKDGKPGPETGDWRRLDVRFSNGQLELWTNDQRIPGYVD